MIKTLVITNYFPPEIGAAANRMFLLCKFLQYHYDLEVACPFPNYPTGKILGNYKGLYLKEKIGGIKTHRLFIYPDNSSSPLKRAISMLSFSFSLWIMLFKGTAKKYDKIIVQNSPLFVSFSSIILFKFLLKKTIILNVSDLWPGSAIDLGLMREKGLSHSIFKAVEKFNYNNSDKILGQSFEILQHVKKISSSPTFLYRNLPVQKTEVKPKKFRNSPVKFFYAGLLGSAQGILNIIRTINSINQEFEFHIYGDGNEKKQIEQYLIQDQSKKIYYHGALQKDQLIKRIHKYDFAIVPLIKNIKGAFPSKIYEYVSLGIPIIYLGQGEAKKFILDNGVGYVLDNSNLEGFKLLISRIAQSKDENYLTLSENCIEISKKQLSFNKQFCGLLNFID
jgi:glycosyltransferase involved in cell wall biosynthesis